MFFLFGLVSKLLRPNDAQYYDEHGEKSHQYPSTAIAPTQQRQRKSCHQLKHERRLERQARRAEWAAARAERRRGGCCGAGKRRRMRDQETAAIGDGSDQQKDTAGAVDSHQHQAFAYQDHPDVAQMQVGYEDADRQGRSAEWHAQAMPNEAPPAYKEAIKA